jgi:hypothetical protein
MFLKIRKLPPLIFIFGGGGGGAGFYLCTDMSRCERTSVYSVYSMLGTAAHLA